MKKVLIVVGDATETVDTLYPYFRVQEDGYRAVVAGPEARLYHMVLHERPLGWDITQETAGYHLHSDIAFRDVVPPVTGSEARPADLAADPAELRRRAEQIADRWRRAVRKRSEPARPDERAHEQPAIGQAHDPDMILVGNRVAIARGAGALDLRKLRACGFQHQDVCREIEVTAFPHGAPFDQMRLSRRARHRDG